MASALPNEIILMITRSLLEDGAVGTASSLAASCSGFYHLATPEVYKFDVLRGECRALYYGCYSGETSIVKHSLRAGASGGENWDVDRPYDSPGPSWSRKMHLRLCSGVNESWAPLRVAAYFGHEKLVSLLLEHGVAIDNGKGGRYAYGQDCSCGRMVPNVALHVAICRGHAGIAALLLQRGACRQLDAWNALHDCAWADNTGTASTIRELDGPEEGPARLTQCLPIAFGRFHWGFVEWCASEGADLDVPVVEIGGTRYPMMYLFLHGGLGGESDAWGRVKWLLALGADPIMTLDHRPADDVRRHNPFFSISHWLITADQKAEFADVLVGRGVDVNAAQSDGTTALHEAVRRMDPEAVRLLLARGAVAHLADSSGWSPLEICFLEPMLPESAMVTGGGGRRGNGNGCSCSISRPMGAVGSDMDLILACARLLAAHGASAARHPYLLHDVCGMASRRLRSIGRRLRAVRFLAENGWDPNARLAGLVPKSPSRYSPMTFVFGLGNIKPSERACLCELLVELGARLTEEDVSYMQTVIYYDTVQSDEKQNLLQKFLGSAKGPVKEVPVGEMPVS